MASGPELTRGVPCDHNHLGRDSNKNELSRRRYMVAVHVGAGYHSQGSSKGYQHAMRRACMAAAAVLCQEGSESLDAVVAAIRVLEDEPLANAGLGSNLTEDGSVECDASVMAGDGCTFGAVGAVPGLRNPVTVAAQLARESQRGPLPLGRIRPIFLAGEGGRLWAEIHAPQAIQRGGEAAMGLITQQSLKKWQRYTAMLQQVSCSEGATSAQADTLPSDQEGPAEARHDKPRVPPEASGDPSSNRKRSRSDPNELSLRGSGPDSPTPAAEELLEPAAEPYLDSSLPPGLPSSLQPSLQLPQGLRPQEEGTAREESDRADGEGPESSPEEDSMMDTVGAICVDAEGRVAAGVSSGGIAMKVRGRIGEAAVYGCGCWAVDSCPVSRAASSSGAGEPLIRAMLARTACEAAARSEGGGPAASCEAALAGLLEQTQLSRGCSPWPLSSDAGILLLEAETPLKGDAQQQLKSVELVAAFTSASFGICYMASSMPSPQAHILRKMEKPGNVAPTSTFCTRVVL